jgi:hypothetical protein
MYICYIDESGTSSVPGNTSHFVVAGVAIPIWHWRAADRGASALARRYDLGDAEFHTAWLLRPYLEQRRIAGFEAMSRPARRAAVERERNAHLLQLQQRQQKKAYQQTRKNFAHTKMYTHLTHAERVEVVQKFADLIGGWGFARLFAECINKLHFDSSLTGRTIDEQSFEQIVSRFEQYLARTEGTTGPRSYGLLVHDNNQTVALKHTALMRNFHASGTLWTRVDRIIETPLFVDSKLTSMVQAADLCAYALRRFVENGESDLLSRIMPRADRVGMKAVGVRHYTELGCTCDICVAHR